VPARREEAATYLPKGSLDLSLCGHFADALAAAALGGLDHGGVADASQHLPCLLGRFDLCLAPQLVAYARVAIVHRHAVSDEYRSRRHDRHECFSPPPNNCNNNKYK
jgi:hypothetical protein